VSLRVYDCVCVYVGVCVCLWVCVFVGEELIHWKGL